MPVPFVNRCLFSILFLSFIVCNSIAQTYQLSDFKKIYNPVAGSNEWKKLLFSEYDFAIKNVDRKIEISKYVRSVDYNKKIIYGGGWELVYQGKGWEDPGMELVVYQPGKAIKQLINLYPFISFLFEYRGGGYFITDIRKGSVLCQVDTVWYTEVVNFDNEHVKAISVYNDSIFIVSHNDSGFHSLYVLSDLKKKMLFERSFWDRLQPNSIAVVDPGNIYLGMRGGYAKVNLPKREIEYFEFRKLKKVSRRIRDHIESVDWGYQ